MTHLRRMTLSLSVLIVSIIGLAGAALADARVALVIGNSDYTVNAKLKNPANDAAAIAAKLTGLGFEVTSGFDLTLDELRDTVRSFARDANGAETAIFYYAGHGMAIDNENYIVPVDASLSDPIDWEFEVYPISRVLGYLNRAEVSLVFLDACRDNPMLMELASKQAMRTRSLTRGLNAISTATGSSAGSIVAYATEPGRVASDGAGTNSPFTTALLNNIDAVNTDFAALTSLITRDVLDMTDGAQRPRFDVSLTGPLVLNKVDEADPKLAVQQIQDTPVVTPAVQVITPQPSTSTASREVERLFFTTAKDTGDVADYEAYLAAYPNGIYATLAHNAIARLTEKKPTNTGLETSTHTAAVPISPTLVNAMHTPLTLRPSAAARAMQSSDFTDRNLGLNNTQSREVQLRLNLSGNNVGAVDGQIGPGTRRGISNWQAQNGFVPNGYLNAVQHQVLVANTHSAFAAHMASNPNALTPPTWQASTPKPNSTWKPNRPGKSQAQKNKEAAAAIAVGVGALLLLKKKKK